VRGIEDVHVHLTAVHVLEAGLDVPAHLGPDRREAVDPAGRECFAASFHVGPPGEPESVAAAQGPAGLDGIDDGRAAAEERVPVARFGLPGHGDAKLLIGVAIGGIHVVPIETIRPLHDVAIEVDHRMAVPAHHRPPSREGIEASRASSRRTRSLFR
jgi:hypothetical protein